ncbi:MAG: bifunctional glutamate N-acetyltransferase/amino-acid acetyltransferase ArgJ [Deltaproteobacteria bacterium]|nr:bifunctional glutamate N-acetyltransferase/amino-acid acetyltransferase ArgJ [Deltaproteobacteria bacterium]
MEKAMCPGFKAAGVIAGIKKNGEKDLGLIYSEAPAKVAGVFTKNIVQAAPVLLNKERIKSGVCQAIIVNSGNANCCTGNRGLTDAKSMARLAASKLDISEDLVFVSSTGVIGQPLPIEKIEAAIPELVKSLLPEGVRDCARAIMTTDTFPKVFSRKGRLKDKTFTVTGIAKGSGMICPDMATMLCFVCTDVDVGQTLLKDALFTATERSFNRITVDGDTSTNDMVLIMANGRSEVTLERAEQINTFQEVLDGVLRNLAKQVVKDGEGATKLVEIAVKGALTRKDAYKIAQTVANSNLVKTAFFGEDANWGRILGATGRAGVSIDPAKIDVYFDDVLMVKNGMGCGDAAEEQATKVLKSQEFTISIDLKMGTGYESVFTCDFSLDYVKINADYRS